MLPRRAIPVLLPMLLLLPAPAGAATWYVSNQGRDAADGRSPATAFASPQRAADATSPGDTVLLLPGRYATPCLGCVVLRVVTSGTAAAPITYAAAPGRRPVIDFSQAGIGIEIDAAYIVVEGLELAGGAAGVTQAYASAHAHDLGDYRTGANGIVVDDTVTGATPHHIVIRDNVVHDAPGAGIATCFADYVTVAGNDVYRNAFWSPYGGSGISLWEMRDTDGFTGYKNFVTGNVSHANREKVPVWWIGSITDGNGIVVDDNENTQSDHVAYGGRTYVADNLVYENGGSGIHTDFSQHVDIVANTAWHNNVSPRIDEGQIFAYESADVNIIDNIGYAPPGKVVTSARGDAASVTSDYNDWFSATLSTGLSGVAPGGALGVAPGGALGVALGAHDLVADPMFADPAARDFRLAPGSPAIGSGTAALAPAVDIRGAPRAAAAGPDRGAFAYPSLP